MTLSYYLPLLMVVLANIGYHNIAKNQPPHANAFLTLAVAYTVSAIVTFALFFIFKGNFKAEFTHLSWTSWALGIVIVGVELGYILMYRAGWMISTAALVANIVVAVLLITLGLLFYKETISLTQALGIFLCLAGLVLVNLK